MQRPASMVGLSRRLVDADLHTGTRVSYISDLLVELGVDLSPEDARPANDFTAAESSAELLPAGKVDDDRLESVLYRILSAIDQAQQLYRHAGGEPTVEELEAVHDHLVGSISYQGLEIDPRLLMPEAYHVMGARIELGDIAKAMLRLLATVETVLPELREVISPGMSLEWDTPLGRVRVAGSGDDHHSGAYALLLDLGGNDVYQDVGQLGSISVVIDLQGNDTILWEEMPGPGAGLLGINVWLDGDGGDDRYQGGSMVEGVGQYGIGILIDEAGQDHYVTGLYGQGFGGPGGIGIQADLQGDDNYYCGELVPDKSPARNKRHAGNHYLGMCQGYAFGIRPKVSGGVGLLLDREGDDHYKADLFAQGASYWFGLGMLVDQSGNDSYEAFEHCQGESLHLGAGFLGDWSGDDRYEGYEHCQGVGMDRAVGMLYDHRGDDSYQATQQSMGAGLKPFGIGMLIEVAGNDSYTSARESQGFAMKPLGFPDSQWPLGMLLDLEGDDVFRQPGSASMNSGVRIQGRQGITLDRPG